MASSVLYVLAVVAFFSCGVFCCEKFPNGTDSKLNWWQCSNGDVTVYSLNTVDKNGNKVYPIHLSKPLYVAMNMTNNSGKDFSNLRLDINLWQWGGWTGCSWHSILTFGLLSDLDACKTGVPCPIKQGNQILTVEVDFSKFSTIINLLKDNAPYQVQYILTDRDTGKATCVELQAKARLQ
jgi:hypothetical protein